MARLFWGADAEINVQDRTIEPVVFSQRFSDVTGAAPMLHGYHVQTEGSQFRLDTSRVDAFIAAELEHLAARPTYAALACGSDASLHGGGRGPGDWHQPFEARRGADLFVSAAADPNLRPRLLEAIRFWDGDGLAGLLEDVRARRLSQHPLMTPTRVARVAALWRTAVFNQPSRMRYGQRKILQGSRSGCAPAC